MHKPRTEGLFAVSILAVLFAGCATEAPCTPGEVSSCSGADGCTGSLTCSLAGEQADCLCPAGDAGTPDAVDGLDGSLDGGLVDALALDAPLLDAGTDTSITSYRTLRVPATPPFETGPRTAMIAGCVSTALSSASAIRDAIANARDGACIRVADGRYDIGSVELSARDVTLASVSRFGAVFDRSSKLLITGDATLIEGIEFADSDANSLSGVEAWAIRVDAVDVHLSHLHFRSWGRLRNRITFVISSVPGSDRLEISDSRFSDLYGMGVQQTQAYNDGFVSTKGIWIHHNEFLDTPNRFNAGGEIIQLGNAYSSSQGVPGPAGAVYDDDSEMIFEYNTVERFEGEGELISLKSSRNVVRYNFVSDSGIAGFVVRMGNQNLIYGNWFVRGTNAPVRISGERNVVAFNYFEAGTSRAAFRLHGLEDYRDPGSATANAYWAANDNLFAKNLLVGFENLAEYAFTGWTTHIQVADPSGSRFERNFLLGSTEGYRNIRDHVSREDFYAANPLVDNHLFSLVGDEWVSDVVIDETPAAPVDVSAYSLFWEGDVIEPPFWWDDVAFGL